MEKEIWKAINGYEGLYEVSSLGRMRSMDKLIESNGGSYLKSGTLLKIQKSTTGYSVLELTNDEGRKKVRVHRVVATVFVENPHGYQYVNHKDGNKENNMASNLEWCTQSYNLKHAYANGLKRLTRYVDRNIKKGAMSPVGRPVVQMTIEGSPLFIYSSVKEAAMTLGFNEGSISMAANGRRKHAHGYTWMFF